MAGVATARERLEARLAQTRVNIGRSFHAVFGGVGSDPPCKVASSALRACSGKQPGPPGSALSRAAQNSVHWWAPKPPPSRITSPRDVERHVGPGIWAARSPCTGALKSTLHRGKSRSLRRPCLHQRDGILTAPGLIGHPRTPLSRSASGLRVARYARRAIVRYVWSSLTGLQAIGILARRHARGLSATAPIPASPLGKFWSPLLWRPAPMTVVEQGSLTSPSRRRPDGEPRRPMARIPVNIVRPTARRTRRSCIRSLLSEFLHRRGHRFRLWLLCCWWRYR